jgi:competence protein ComEC
MQAGFSMLDIGQGDSFLIQSATGARMLIDGGPTDNKVLAELAQKIPSNDRSIAVVIATHPDADHIGGLAQVFKRYHVGVFLTEDVQTDTQTEATLLQTIRDERVAAYYVRHGMHIVFSDSAPGAMHFDILFPDRSTATWVQTNPASIVGKLFIGNRTALFTGDSPSSIEHYLVQHIPSELKSDILKLGHHGSKYSSSTPFLKVVVPALALVSAGVNNRYGHPNPDTLARLATLHIPYVSTQDHGTVTFTVENGKWVEEDEK